MLFREVGHRTGSAVPVEEREAVRGIAAAAAAAAAAAVAVVAVVLPETHQSAVVEAVLVLGAGVDRGAEQDLAVPGYRRADPGL